MPEYHGQLRATGRVAILVSQYNERVTARLLEGARACCAAAGVPEADVDVVWLPGAFELGGAASAVAQTGQYGAIVALGCVVRGETAHFDFVAGEAARGISEVAVRHGLPVAFGVLPPAKPVWALSPPSATPPPFRMAPKALRRKVLKLGLEVPSPFRAPTGVP